MIRFYFVLALNLYGHLKWNSAKTVNEISFEIITWDLR